MTNRDFRVTFQPKEPGLFNGRVRFSVSVNTLKNYIGAKNAETAFLRALNSKDDKIRVRFRKFGIVDFYTK